MLLRKWRKKCVEQKMKKVWFNLITHFQLIKSTRFFTSIMEYILYTFNYLTTVISAIYIIWFLIFYHKISYFPWMDYQMDEYVFYPKENSINLCYSFLENSQSSRWKYLNDTYYINTSEVFLKMKMVHALHNIKSGIQNR